MNGSTAAIVVIGGVALIGGIAYAASQNKTTPPPGQIPTAIALSAASTTEAVNTPDLFTATLTDQNGNPIANYTLTFSEIGIGSVGTAATNASGVATLNIQFASAGTYTVMASA